MTPGSPFDDIRNLLASLPAGNDAAAAAIGRKAAAGDFGGAGKLTDIATWLARWSGKGARVEKPMIAIFAGAHGISRHGVATENDSDVQKLVEAISAGEAPIAKLCGSANIGLKVLDLAVDLPTGDITQGEALDERDCAATMAFGMEAVAGGHDLLCLSGLGAGGDVVAAAVLAGLSGEMAEAWLDEATTGGAHLRLRTITALNAALVRHHGSLENGLHVIGLLGGREIAAMAGAIIAARIEHVPVLLDGLPALAAAAALHKADPDAVSHCLMTAKPGTARAAILSQRLGTGWIAEGLVAAPGVESAVAVGLVRAAAWTT